MEDYKDVNSIDEIDQMIQELRDSNKIDHMLELCHIGRDGKFTENKEDPSIFPLLKQMDEKDVQSWSFSEMPPLDTFCANSESHESSKPSKPYNEVLKETKQYHNPFSVHNMCLLYGLSDYSSLYRDLSVPEEENYRQLRYKQESKWALQRVQAGIQHAKENNYTKAINCYNEALNLIPNYADAFTARGAAYVKQKKIKEGIQDFKQALKCDPNTQNAAIYLAKAEKMLQKEKTTTIQPSLLSSSVIYNKPTPSKSPEKVPSLSNKQYNDYLNQYLDMVDSDSLSVDQETRPTKRREESRSNSAKSSRHRSSHHHHHHRHRHT